MRAEGERDKSDRSRATFDNLMRNLDAISTTLTVLLWMVIGFALVNAIVVTVG